MVVIINESIKTRVKVKVSVEVISEAGFVDTNVKIEEEANSKLISIMVTNLVNFINKIILFEFLEVRELFKL